MVDTPLSHTDHTPKISSIIHLPPVPNNLTYHVIKFLDQKTIPKPTQQEFEAIYDIITAAAINLDKRGYQHWKLYIPDSKINPQISDRFSEQESIAAAQKIVWASLAGKTVVMGYKEKNFQETDFQQEPPVAICCLKQEALQLSNLNTNHKNPVLLSKLVVSPDEQGKGYGKKIINTAINNAIHRYGADSAKLDVNKDYYEDETSGIKGFYSKLGFSEIDSDARKVYLIKDLNSY